MVRLTPHAGIVVRNAARRAARAFTLVELLVVIGIIALLISILLPSLSRAQEAGRRIACLSNLRQIAMATVMYTSANKGVFPGQGGGALMPHNWIQWKNEPPDNWDINDSTFVQYLATGEALKRIYRCPSDDFLARPVASSSVTPYRYSYSMNQMLTNPNQSSYKVAPYNLPTLKFVRISQVRSASSKILLVDETDQTIDDGVWKPFLILDATANPPTFQGTTNPNQIADRHERRKDKTDLQGHGNVAFVDGHAAIIDRMEAGKQEYHDPFR